MSGFKEKPDRSPKVLADVAPESLLLLGAGSAILLQLANPAVGYGVARHSNFAADPLKRLHGTLSYIYALSNGTPAQRKHVQQQVQRAHLPVKSAAGAGNPAYNSADPALQLWVAATLYKSAAQTYDSIFPALDARDGESVYLSYSVLGTALGMPAQLWPGSTADFAEYWAQQLGQLSVDETVREVARELLAAKHAPLWIKVIMPVARFLTIGFLPPAVRQMYGFNWSPRKDKYLRLSLRAAALLARITPRWIRHSPMRYYLKRI
ncbi:MULTISPECIES: oxygenase MpaB family protein [Arthrobacter]|uniref:oxygenase MpaB family protein n=1 Tax=unclassified Arthrobacter TaxID=235627 RepID=UPI0024BB41EC|nr:oxygenase MpaB family protein [Arthrobacter sp. H35-MC1]MDJ0316942.1 oxygenase MpaB family protein [Arthrobacter sp. H35-MC1]